ncbi:meiosis-specific kinetochore protein-like [Castor canadensis]|uniref:Meiosis-specific kinetochore protein-like n=1 Tax=Castor canadensis TaxID=51338 RepID=A0AC58LC63_CASCN
MWPLRVYTRKKRAGQRLNLTPTPDLRLPTKTEASSALGGRKRPGKEQGLPRIGEKVEQSGSGLASDQVGEESVRERSTTSEETQDEKGPPGSVCVLLLQWGCVWGYT